MPEPSLPAEPRTLGRGSKRVAMTGRCSGVGSEVLHGSPRTLRPHLTARTGSTRTAAPLPPDCRAPASPERRDHLLRAGDGLACPLGELRLGTRPRLPLPPEGAQLG